MKIITNILRKHISKLNSKIKFLRREIDRLNHDVKNYEIEIQKVKNNAEADVKKEKENTILEIEKLHTYYKPEIESIENRTVAKYKTIIETDRTKIETLEKFITKNKSMYDALKQREGIFKETMSKVIIDLQTIINLHTEANKYLTAAKDTYGRYEDKFLPSDKQIENDLEER
jgi:predicted  nucleic acid-binding Zn-ribbon protein